MEYRLCEDIINHERIFARRNARLMQMIGMGGKSAISLPHVTGKGYFAFTYFIDGETKWLDDYTDYSLTLRRNTTMNVCTVNAIDEYVQKHLYELIRERLRVKLVGGNSYFVDAEFSVALRNNEVDDFELTGIVMVSEFRDV